MTREEHYQKLEKEINKLEKEIAEIEMIEPSSELLLELRGFYEDLMKELSDIILEEEGHIIVG